MYLQIGKALNFEKKCLIHTTNNVLRIHTLLFITPSLHNRFFYFFYFSISMGEFNSFFFDNSSHSLSFFYQIIVMLASIPIQSSTKSRRYLNNDWPLNEIEENMMTLATCSQINKNLLQLSATSTNLQNNNNSWRKSNTRYAAVRCNACQRKFHSLGNLANHQQLYQH
jgi:hypothetical protein